MKVFTLTPIRFNYLVSVLWWIYDTPQARLLQIFRTRLPWKEPSWCVMTHSSVCTRWNSTWASHRVSVHLDPSRQSMLQFQLPGNIFWGKSSIKSFICNFLIFKMPSSSNKTTNSQAGFSSWLPDFNFFHKLVNEYITPFYKTRNEWRTSSKRLLENANI